jgi:hypothetical protein
VTQAFISAFARLEQKVIMRFDPKFLTNVPDNVMVANWVPQQDILGLIFLNNISMSTFIISINTFKLES